MKRTVIFFNATRRTGHSLSVLKILSVCLLASLFFLPHPAEAKVYINIDSPTIQKFPIAITDFRNIGKSSDRENLSIWFPDQLSKMLILTNYFDILDKKSFLEPPGEGGLTSGTIRFSDWSSIGAELLVKGGYQFNGRELVGEFMLFDVVLGKLITGKKYTGTLENRREMVLKFANEIFLALTGEKGIFDTKIAFAAKRGKISDLYTIDFDGSGLKRLTDLKALTLLPQWSPDGLQIAFTSYRSGNPDLYLIGSQGGRERRISSYRGLNIAGGWAADGRSLLVTSSKNGKQEIFRFDLKGNAMTPLTRDSSISVSPSWSPDGSRIVFTSDREGSPQIYMMDADGSNVRRVTFDGKYNTSPRWSPKGDRIAFESLRGGTFQIMTMGVDGQNIVQLTSEGRNESPSWSPDGRHLVFVSTKRGKSRVCIINSNGSTMRVLHEGADGYLSPHWSPHLNFN